MCGNYCNRGGAGGGGEGSDGAGGRGTACKREMDAVGSYDMHYANGNMILYAFYL